MVCGLCHREDTDHALSTSGPTRCKYTTHRENCPGNFKTKCEEHIVSESKHDENESKLLDAMASLNINTTTGKVNRDELSPEQIQTLANLAVQLGQTKDTKRPDNDPDDVTNTVETPSNSTTRTPVPTPTLDKSMTPNIAASGLPWQHDSELPQHTPGPLDGIEEFVRLHIAKNQQNLQQSQDGLAQLTLV